MIQSPINNYEYMQTDFIRQQILNSSSLEVLQLIVYIPGV